MSLNNVSDQDIVECLQNCPELDGPLFDVNVLDELCLTDELWANLDFTDSSLPAVAQSMTREGSVTTATGTAEKVSEDLGVVTPPYSPPTLCSSPSSSVSSPPPVSMATTPASVNQAPPSGQVISQSQTLMPSQAKISPSQCKVASQQISTGLQGTPSISKQQPSLSVMDTGAQLTSLCSQITLPHFNGSLQVLKSGETVPVQHVPMTTTSLPNACTSSSKMSQQFKLQAPQMVSQMKQEQPVVGQKRQRSPDTGTAIDVSKLTKKQQRMIKNRESASISRQKKRQYVDALEARLKEAALKNSALLQENTSLRKQVSFLEQENESLRSCVSNPSSPLSIGFSSLKKPTIVMMLFLCFSFTALYYNRDFIHLSHTSLSPSTALAHVKTRALLSVDTDNSVSRYDPHQTIDTAAGSAPASHALVPVSAEVYSKLEERLRRWRLHGEELEQEVPAQHHGCSCPENQTRKINSTNIRLINEELTSCFKLNSLHSFPTYFSSFDNVKNSLTVVNPDNPTQQPTYLVDGPEKLYQDFKKFIPRDLENYYLLSFKDHILLHPPLPNSSHFPFLSVLIPADSDYTSLLQVDCEVTATKIIRHLRG